MPKFNEYAFREPLAAAYNLVGVPLNKATEFVTGYNPGFSGERLFNLDMKNRKPDTAEFFGMDTGAKRGFTYQNESQQKIEDQKLKDTALKDDYELRMQKLKDDYEKRIEGLKGAASPDLTEEQQLIKQTELYQKLLGGDEAKSQSIYDALLAASPAFFKGKNLREALPEVLSSVEKSRSLDKPMDVRQVAAQLALQRRITLDKAAAEERTRLALLAAKEAGKTPEELYTEFKKVDPTEAINLAGYSTYKDKFAGPAPLIKSGKQQQFDSSKIDFNKIYSYGSSFITFKEQTNPDTGLREIVPVTIKSYK